MRARANARRRFRASIASRNSTKQASTRSGSSTSSDACGAASRRARRKCSRPKPRSTTRRSASPRKSRASTSSCAARSSGSKSHDATPTISAKRLRITLARLDAGRGTQLDASRAQAQLSATLATIPDLEESVTRSILRLGVLIGESPETLLADLGAPRDLPALPATHSIGTPEALLRRRPDILGAERDLAAATARIGVAVGDLFPRITFVGRWGFDAFDSGDLGDAGSETWSFGPSIQWAAFDLGRVKQRINATRSSRRRRAREVRADGVARARGDRRKPDRVREGAGEAGASAGKRDSIAAKPRRSRACASKTGSQTS